MRILSFVLVALWTVGAGAQSLGDVARKEAARRKTVMAPGKTYTNDQLKAEPLCSARPPSTPVPAATAAPATGAPAPPSAGAPAAGRSKAGAQARAPAGAAPGPPATEAAPAAKGEAEWKAKGEATKAALSGAQIFAEALQSRI